MEGLSFKFYVDYIVGEGVDVDTSKVYLVDDTTNQLVRTFKDRNTAFRFFERYKKKKLRNFANITWLDLRNSGVLMEGEFEVFNPSVNLGFNIWEVSSDHRKIIGMGYPFTKLLKGIKTGLRELFNKNEFHGNLRNGILISRKFDVKLFNVFDQSRKVSIKDGIKRDLEDFIQLVKLIIQNNQHPILEEPDWISPLFTSFNNLFKNMILHPTIQVDKNE